MSANRKIGVDRDFDNNQALNLVVETVAALPSNRPDGTLIFVATTQTTAGKLYYREDGNWRLLDNSHLTLVNNSDIHPDYLEAKVNVVGLTKTTPVVGDKEILKLENKHISIDSMDDIQTATNDIVFDGILVWDESVGKYTKANLGIGLELHYVDDTGGTGGSNSQYTIRVSDPVADTLTEHTFNMVGDIIDGDNILMYVYADGFRWKYFYSVTAVCRTGSCTVELVRRPWPVSGVTQPQEIFMTFDIDKDVPFTKLLTSPVKLNNNDRLEVKLSNTTAATDGIVITMILKTEARYSIAAV